MSAKIKLFCNLLLEWTMEFRTRIPSSTNLFPTLKHAHTEFVFQEKYKARLFLYSDCYWPHSINIASVADPALCTIRPWHLNKNLCVLIRRHTRLVTGYAVHRNGEWHTNTMPMILHGHHMFSCGIYLLRYHSWKFVKQLEGIHGSWDVYIPFRHMTI